MTSVAGEDRNLLARNNLHQKTDMTSEFWHDFAGGGAESLKPSPNRMALAQQDS